MFGPTANAKNDNRTQRTMTRYHRLACLGMPIGASYQFYRFPAETQMSTPQGPQDPPYPFPGAAIPASGS